jgi:hypothetical protein
MRLKGQGPCHAEGLGGEHPPDMTFSASGRRRVERLMPLKAPELVVTLDPERSRNSPRSRRIPAAVRDAAMLTGARGNRYLRKM